MKTFRDIIKRNCIWGLLFVLLGGTAAAGAPAGSPLCIVYPEFYPFFEQTPEGKTRGFFYEIVTHALEQRLQIPTQWRLLPWKRCQAYVKSGKYDAMITVPTAERLAYAGTHSTPFYEKKLTLFTYRGHGRMDQIAAIRSAGDIKRGGFTVITYSGNGWHENNLSSLGIPSLEVPRVHLVWKMLAAQRGDLVIEWPVGAYSGMDKAGVKDQIVETGAWLAAMKFHLMISKKSRFLKILPRFNHAIESMFADGTMDRILAPYIQGEPYGTQENQ